MRNLCWISFIIRHGREKAVKVSLFFFFIANQVLVQAFRNGYLTTIQIVCLVPKD